MFSKVLMALMVCFCFAAGSDASGGDRWQIDHQKSSMFFSGTHAGNPFEGELQEWEADIRFDPENIQAAMISVTVQSDSAYTGNALYDTTLKTEDWFHVEAFPIINFQSSSITRLSGDSYKADGVVTLKGIAEPIEILFDLVISQKNAHAQGAILLNRTNLGLGTKSDPDASWVSKEIKVSFEVHAVKE